MKKIIVVLLLFIGLQGMFAQTIVKNIGDFTTVKAFDRIQVELIPASESKVEISGTGKENAQVVNKDGELKIRMTTDKLMTGDGVKAKVYYSKELSSVQGSEGSIVTGKAKIDTGLLFLNAKEGAKVNVEVDVQKITARVNSGGEITVSGDAVEQDIVITSGGKYNAKEAQSKNVAVAINAGGNAVINASGMVNAKTRAGGVIDIYGGPEVSPQTLAGGKINVH